MNRAAALSFVAVAIAAGAWMTWRSPDDAPEAEPVAGACTSESPASCGAGDAPAPEPEPRQRSRRATDDLPPGGSAVPPVASGDFAAEGERLREKAERLLAEGRVHEAVNAMREAAEVDPSARNHGDLGALLERLTAFREAARHLTRAAELDPSNADRWLAAANAWYRAVDPGEAWKAERRAKEAEPGIELRRDADGRLVRKDDTGAPKP